MPLNIATLAITTHKGSMNQYTGQSMQPPDDVGRPPPSAAAAKSRLRSATRDAEDERAGRCGYRCGMARSRSDGSTRSRLLLQGRSRLRLELDASVTLWTGHDPDLPALVGPESPMSAMAFVDVIAERAWRRLPARSELLAACGRVQVRDQLLAAAEPVGRAEPGVALVRLVRCLDGPLDVTHDIRLARPQRCGDIGWRSLNRVVFGYFADRKITVDGGEVSLRVDRVSSRLRADAGDWCVMSVAFDGHLPADPALAAALLR